MKLLIAFVVLFSVSLQAEEKMVALDMKAGLWEYTNDMSGINSMIEKSLAKMPKDQREMVRKMMASKMKQVQKIKQCLTEDMIKDPRKYMKEATKKHNSKCKMVVKKSTNKFFAGSYSCPKEEKMPALSMKIEVQVKNKTTVDNTTFVPGPDGKETKMKSQGKWISAKCPESKKKV